MLGDADVPLAVRAGPDVRDVAEVVQERSVEARGIRIPVRLEDEQREERGDPDQAAAPEEDREHRTALADQVERQKRVEPERATVWKCLPHPHGAVMLTRQAFAPLRRNVPI